MTLALNLQPIEAMPGAPARVGVEIRNDGTSPTFVSLSVAGIEPGWLVVPPTVGPVAPGESVQAEIELVVPAGHPACQLTGSLTARAGSGEMAQADLTVTVLDGSIMAAALDPASVRGGTRGRAVLVLRNRGASPVRVDLEATAPEPELRVRFKDKTRVVHAGQEVRVPTRVSAPRPLFGAVRHRPFVVSVRTRGTPVQLEGAFFQRAVLAPWMTKVLAIVAVVGLWATVAVVGITSISKHTNKTAQQNAINNAPPVTTVAGPSAGNPNAPANPATSASAGGAGGGSGGSGSGSGGSASGSGSGGSGSGSSGGGAAATTGASAPSRVSGKVAAGQPGGVTVTVQPTSSGAGPTQVATVSSGSSSNIVLAAATFPGPLTKLYGADLPAVGGSLPASTVRPAATSPGQPNVLSYSTTTSPDGFWAFASVPPGSYTVSFSKPGYSDASYVVQVTGNGQAVSLASKLVPGNGSASGTVRDGHGPLGGVQLTITNGTVTLTTHTPTSGKVGTWAVNGLPTPGTYLVTATDPGYSNQTTLFTLGAGGSASGLKLTMVPGQGSLSGTVVSARDGQPEGGLTVSVSNGSVTQKTTTTTTGAVGTYDLPDLPVPGTYALTVSGPGFVTQTQQAVLGSDQATDNATVNASVTPSGADVAGVATDANGQGLPAAGAILSNQNNVFKTLTTSSGTVGSFDFGQVPPGDYVLTVEDFGYTTQSAQVTVASGQVQTVNLSLPVSTSATDLSTASIQGTVLSLVTAKPIVGAVISLDGQPGAVTTGANGSYSISKVGPGTHTVTASCPSASSCQSADLVSNKLIATEFDTTSVQVAVALGAVIFAPQILMPKLDQLAGIVIDGNGQRVPNPTVTLKNNASGVSYTANSNPIGSGATAPQGGFEFDNLPSGTYTMTVQGPPPPTGASAACPGVEQYQTLTSAVNLDKGTNYLLNGSPGTPNASPVLTVLPQYRVTTNVDFGGGTPTPTSGVTVEVQSATPGVIFDQVCNEATTEPVVELPVADIGDAFTASFSYTQGSTKYQAPVSDPFTANYNYATVDTALLVPPTPGVTVSLSFPWRLPTGAVSCTATTAPVSPCPALQNTATEQDFPAVTITGNFVHAGGTTATSSVTATPSVASGTWTFSPASLIGLLPGAVTFTVSGGAFQTLSTPANTSDPGYSLQAFTLAPRLSKVAGTLSEPPGSPLSPAVQIAPPDPNLVVSAASTGDVIWQQVGQTLGQAFPGVYDVTLSQAGYDTTVIQNFDVPLCAASCTATLGQPTTGTPAISPNTISYASDGTGPITLAAHVTLTVTPNYTPISGLAYPTVTLTNASGAVMGSQQLSATKTAASFTGLSATGNAYTVTISAPSFVTSTTTVTLPFQPSTSYVATDNPSLIALGYLTGMVQGLINTSPVPIAGATVTATLTNPGTCSGTPPVSASGQTLADGSFTLTSTTPGYAGLCVGAAYSLDVTPPAGYGALASPLTGSVLAGATAVNGGAPIQLQAARISQTFTVTDGTNPLSGVTVTGSSVIGRPVTGATADGTNGTTLGAVTVSPDPTTYTYTFQLAGYASYSETVSYIVGETTSSTPNTAPSLSVALAIDHNTISGVVSTPGSCGSSASSCPLGGVTVSLMYPPASPHCAGTTPCAVLDSSNQPATTTSSSTSPIGSYSFSYPTVSIPDGSYLIQASLTNWQESSTYQEGLVTSPSLLTVKNVSMAPAAVPLSVTVSSNLSTIPFNGATVSLVPAIPPANLALPCAAGGSPTLPATGEGTSQISSAALSSGTYVAYFPSVTPDYYTLSVQSRGLPAQTSDAVVVCPGGNVAEFTPAPTSSSATPVSPFPAPNTASFEALAGQITGTVAVSSNSSISASSLSVYITPHTGNTGTTDTVSVTCSNPCTQGTFTSDLLSLGATYDVYAEPNPNVTGYADSAPGSVTLSASTPPSGPVTVYAPSSPSGPFPASSPLTVAPAPVEVQVTVGDANHSNAAISGVHVTLTDTTISGDSSLQILYGTGGLDSSIGHGASYTYGPYTQTTNSSGVATFNQVVPDPNGTYAVTLCYGTCTSGSPGTPLNLDSGGSSVTSEPITVSIGQNSNNNSVEAYYSGSITGAVYDTNANLANDAVYLCASTVTTCNASNATESATESSSSTTLIGNGTWTPLSVASGAAQGTYTFSPLTPGTWYVASNVAVQGSTTTTSASVDVGPGAAVNGSSTPSSSPTFVATTGITVTVNGSKNDTVIVCVADPAASPCTTSVPMSYSMTLTGTGQTGSATHTFSPLTVSPPTGESYYVTAATTPSSSNPSSQTITVLPGASASAQTATLTEPGYSVTYFGNGSGGGAVPVDSNTYYHSSKATVLGNINSLTKTGYTFSGWNTSSTGGGTSYAAGDNITMSGNVSLYAAWNPDLSFDPNATGTSGSVPATTSYASGSSITLPGNTGSLVNSGYTFEGWSGSNTGSALTSPYTMPSTPTTLYAVWYPNLTFNVNGGSGTVPATTGVAPGSTVSLPTGLTKTGYAFGGWSATNGGSAVVTPYSMPSSPTTLYAIWTANTYTVTYDANGGTGTVPTDSNSYTYGASVTVQGNTGSLTNGSKTFQGWSMQSGKPYGTLYGPAPLTPTFSMPASNVTLYAAW